MVCIALHFTYLMRELLLESLWMRKQWNNCHGSYIQLSHNLNLNPSDSGVLGFNTTLNVCNLVSTSWIRWPEYVRHTSVCIQWSRKLSFYFLPLALASLVLSGKAHLFLVFFFKSQRRLKYEFSYDTSQLISSSLLFACFVFIECQLKILNMNEFKGFS